MSKGRVEEARQFLVDYHGNGDENDELVNFTFKEIQATLAAVRQGQIGIRILSDTHVAL